MTPFLPLLATGMYLIFFTLMLVFVIFTIFLGYHWFNYGSSKQASTLTLAIFLIVSAPLFLTMSLALSVVRI